VHRPHQYDLRINAVIFSSIRPIGLLFSRARRIKRGYDEKSERYHAVCKQNQHQELDTTIETKANDSISILESLAVQSVSFE